MITNKQKEASLASSENLIKSITEFKSLTAENGLPVSDNIQTLETALRSQLFQKLLAVDKGLKLRWDMLKTDEARIKLITETVNLDGYSQVKELQDALKDIERQYNKVWTGETFLHKVIAFPLFADKWQMDLEAVLNSMVFNWTGKEDVLEYFQNLAPALSKLREVFRSVTHESFSLHETLLRVSHYYTPESVKGSIEAEESAVMGLANELDKSNARHLLTE